MEITKEKTKKFFLEGNFGYGWITATVFFIIWDLVT